MAMAIKRGCMNLKKELIKAGFEDQTHIEGMWTDEETEFDLACPIVNEKGGAEILDQGSIRLLKRKDSDQTEITIYSESGYELLIGMADAEAG